MGGEKGRDGKRREEEKERQQQWQTLLIPVLERQRQKDYQGSLATQSTLLSSKLMSEIPCSKNQGG